MYPTISLYIILLALLCPVTEAHSPRPLSQPQSPQKHSRSPSARFPRNAGSPLLQPAPRRAPPHSPTLLERTRDFIGRKFQGKRDTRLGPGPGKDYNPAAAYAQAQARARERKREMANQNQHVGLGTNFEKRQTDLADSASLVPTSTLSAAGANSTAVPNITDPDVPVWILNDVYEGADFFDYWYFWDHQDKTNGLVDYVTREQAEAEKLAYVRPDGKVIMKADNTTVLNSGDWRKSVRIESQKSYTGGLFILDMDRAPHGCGIWPAFWTSSANWPFDGEIDVYEGVHESTNNQVAWHTDKGCTLKVPGKFSGTPEHTDCYAYVNDNSGCTVVDASGSSSGSTFANLGGGVYAMKWDETGISVWFFPRSVIPQDITSFTPDPTQWGTPSAHLSPDECDVIKYFQNHVIIFNITFCGDWAGMTYLTSGCPGTCNDRVMDPRNFDEAVWNINHLRVYTNAQLAAGILNDAPRRVSSPQTSWGIRLGLAVASLTMLAIM